MCDHKYLVRHCKPACGTCPHEEQRLTCQGIQDAMEAHLAENPVFGGYLFQSHQIKTAYCLSNLSMIGCFLII